MSTISISISNTEYSALEYVAISPEEWADNVISNRARIAIEEIVSLYTARALNENVPIPSTREEIVADAYARGWIKTVVQTNAEMTQLETP